MSTNLVDIFPTWISWQYIFSLSLSLIWRGQCLCSWSHCMAHGNRPLVLNPNGQVVGLLDHCRGQTLWSGEGMGSLCGCSTYPHLIGARQHLISFSLGGLTRTMYPLAYAPCKLSVNSLARSLHRAWGIGLGTSSTYMVTSIRYSAFGYQTLAIESL